MGMSDISDYLDLCSKQRFNKGLAIATEFASDVA